MPQGFFQSIRKVFQVLGPLFAERPACEETSITLQLHLANAQENRLALWDLAMLYEIEGRHRDSEQTLAILLRENPNDSDALAASGTIATMQIYFDMQNEKRKADVEMKGPARIEDESVRESLRSEFGPRIQATEAALDRASQIDPHASQPLVMLNFIYRMKAQLAPTGQEFDDLIRKADAFVDRAVPLNPGKPYPATTTAKLNPLEPPPPLPGPPPPPPPPPAPKPSGSQ